MTYRLPPWVVAAAWVTAYAITTAVAGPSGTAADWIGDGVYLVPLVVALVLCARRVRDASGRRRTLWLLLTGYAVLWLAGETCFSVAVLAFHRVLESPSVADGFYLSSYVAGIASVGVALWPRERIRVSMASIDVGLALAAIAFGGWTLVLGPLVRGAHSSGDFVVAAYPLCDMAIVMVIVSLALTGREALPRSIRLVALSFVAAGVTDSVYTYATSLHTYTGSGMINVGWQVQAVLLALAAVEARGERLDPDAGRTTRDVGLIPAIAAAAVVTSLFGYQVTRGEEGVATVALVGVVLLALCARFLTVDIQLRQLHRAQARRSEELEELVGRRTEALRESQAQLRRSWEASIRRLAAAVNWRDEETGEHIDRIGTYSRAVALRLGLPSELVELLAVTSPLHDIGKIAVPDAVLHKPGPLTAGERAVIETHAEIGYTMLAGSGVALLDFAAVIARTHHEHWDGGGYPHGLAGEVIPLAGRIVAVCDVFDALTSDRVYRPAFSLQQALELLEAGRGLQFDPAVLDARLAVLPGLFAAPALAIAA